MQNKIKEYVKDAAKSKKRRLNVCLWGFGATNLAVFSALSENEAISEITVRQNGKIYHTPPHNARLIYGKKALENIYEDIIFASPSLRREKLNLPPTTVVTSDTEIFFGLQRKNSFLVSGSDGKSTTTTIASLLLSPTFPELFTGGNIGTPIALASLSSDAFLLEISSFSLRYCTPRSSRALLTNVTPNHLDWHRDYEEYKECKAKLIGCAEEAILTLCCPFNERLAGSIKSFALVSDYHSDEELRSKYDVSHTVTIQDSEVCIDGEEIISVSEIKLTGRYNLLNFMSAMALSLGYTTTSRIREVAKSFSGLSHRCETFTVGDRIYINSSIDTTPERTRATLESLGKSVNLILGGRGKGLPLSPMRSSLIAYAKRISLYGEIAEEIYEWIDNDPKLSAIPHECFTTLKEAIDDADDGYNTVLLSPAATAYGEFRNFEERGCFFKEYIREKHT